MKNTVTSHAAFGCATAVFASGVTDVTFAGWSEWMSPPQAPDRARV